MRATPHTHLQHPVRMDGEAEASLRNLSRHVQDSIFETLEELRMPTDSEDPDERMWRPKAGRDTWYFYRRGLTRAKRQELDEAERRGEDLDHEAVSENPWDYAIVYRETTTSECIRYKAARGITVMRILSMREVLGVLRRRYPDVLNNY